MKETGVDFFQSKVNDRCYYVPSEHRIVSPPDNHIYSKEAMLTTLAHEIDHSTSKGLEREVCKRRIACGNCFCLYLC